MKRNNLKLSKREEGLLKTLVYGCLYLSVNINATTLKTISAVECQADFFKDYSLLLQDIHNDDFSPNSMSLLSIIMIDFNLPFLKRQIEIKDKYKRNEFLKP